MLTTHGIALRDILIALAILAFSWLGYRRLRAIARGMVAKTGSTLDKALLEALEQPLYIAIVLAGIYFAIISLPLALTLENAIRRGFYVVIAGLGIYSGIHVVDAILKWYKVEIASRTSTDLDNKLASFLRLAIPVVGGILGLVVLLELAGIPATPVKAWLGQHGSRLALIALLAVGGLLAISNLVPAMIKAAMNRGVAGETEEELRKRADTLATVLVTTGQFFVILVAGFMLLSELGVNIAPVLAGVGVAGIAIGFGAQSLVKDFISGLFIVLENQYRVGDVVRIADISGLVEDISLRKTVLRDLDGIVHHVPNGEIRTASNFTRGYSRVNLNISVAYDTDLDHAIAVINRVGKELAEDPNWAPLILKPPQVLRVDKLGDSGIEIKIVGDTQPIRQWDIMGQLRLRIKKAFDAEGIEIPWPHTKVYFGNTPFPNMTGERAKEE